MALKKKQKTIDRPIEIVQVEIDKIKVDRKGCRSDEVDIELVESIKTIGLLNPITITTDYALIAGGRRFAAVKNLGWRTISATIYRSPEGTSEDLSELAHLDENIVRKNLTDYHFDEALAQRKAIYERLYPETKQGGDRKSSNYKTKSQTSTSDSFVEDTAKKTGKSLTNIKDSVRRHEKSSDTINEMYKRGELSKSKVTELVSLEKEQQDKIATVIGSKTKIEDIKTLVGLVKVVGVDVAVRDFQKGYGLKEGRLLATLEETTRQLDGFTFQAENMLPSIEFKSAAVPKIEKLISTTQKILNSFQKNSDIEEIKAVKKKERKVAPEKLETELDL